MKWFYTMFEIITIFGLIQYGEDMGSRNIWYMTAAVLIAHTIFSFLYKLRRYSEIHNHKITDIPKIISKAEKLATENANIKIRHIYDDETGKDRVLCDFAKG